MWRSLRGREVGAVPPRAHAAVVRSVRLDALDLSRSREIFTAHRAAVNSLQVDGVEARYLLSGAADGSIALYDIEVPSSYEKSAGASQHKSLYYVDKNTPQGHRFSVSSVQWYPVDTGIFISGSFDKNVNVWDTNSLKVALQFPMPGKVFAVAMSAMATRHTLIAVGSEDPIVRLCDVTSGACTHTLSGHRDAIWALHWSVSSEWVLASGGCDGAVRLWDIRRAGSFLLLDQQQSALENRKKKSFTNLEQFNRQENKTRGMGSGSRSLEDTKRRKTPMASLSERRVHPGLLSAQDQRTAHDGAVTALQMTPDGRHMLSTGTDSRMRLWDIASGGNMLVNYGGTRNRALRGTQFAISNDGSRVYHPSGIAIQVFDTWTGRLLSTLKGHFEVVHCCSFHPWDQELFSGSGDRQILAWGPPPPPGFIEDHLEKGRRDKKSYVLPDVDAWSDDEDLNSLKKSRRLMF